jgi:hypothetical protein
MVVQWFDSIGSSSLKHTPMKYQILATQGEIWQSILVAETNDLKVAEAMLGHSHPMLPKDAALFIYDRTNNEIITYKKISH